MTNIKPLSVDYSDEKLRVLVEEFITQQKTEFTFKGICAYILYWAMEDGKVAEAQGTLCEGNQLAQADCDRISGVLDKIVDEGCIGADGEHFKKLKN